MNHKTGKRGSDVGIGGRSGGRSFKPSATRPNPAQLGNTPLGGRRGSNVSQRCLRVRAQGRGLPTLETFDPRAPQSHAFETTSWHDWSYK
jgi:hypothetical protein